MKFWTDSFESGSAIPEAYALGKFHPETHVTFAGNQNPSFSWSELPDGTKSLVLICHDSEVPSRGDDVNQEGKTVPHGLERVDFYHWVLVDIRPDGSIAEGSHSTGVTSGGKDGPGAANGARHGINSYTGWFEGDEDMKGLYYGYDGPGPPWNDERIHIYHFTLYALDVDHCPVEGARFTGADVLKAMEGHILDQAALGGTYHIYKDAK